MQTFPQAAEAAELKANTAPPGTGPRPGAFGAKGGRMEKPKAARRERGIKKLADGRWRYSWTFRGRYHRMTAPNYAIARACLSKIRAEIAEGRYLEKEATPRVTFERAAQDFLTWGKSNLAPGTWIRDRQFVARWLRHPRFEGRTLDEISPADIEAYRNGRLATVGKRTADYDLSRLKRLFSLAQAWGLCKADPTRPVKLFHPDNRRERFLSAEEEKVLRAALPEWVRPAFDFALNTGLRQMELLTLTWGQVDLARRTITLTADKTKSKRTRHVPLNVAALAALKSQPRALSPEAPVFPVLARTRQASLVQIVRRTVRRLGLEGVTWHTLRHTFASRLVQRGVGLLTVKDLLGHSTLTMVLRYAHLADENLRRAVDTLTEDPNLHETCTGRETAPGGGEA